MLIDSLLLALLMVAWGAQAVVPWRLAGTAAAAAERTRRVWRLVGLPLALAAPVAAYAFAGRNPDATIAARLVPLPASPPGRLLAVAVPAVILAAALAALAGDRLAGTGERLAAALGLLVCAVAAWAGELVRIGEGPDSVGPRFLLLVACRLALMLAAGELPAPGRARWAVAGGAALLLYLPLLPAEVRRPMWGQGLELTCGAAALLLLAARWLPRTLRPLALAFGLLLGAVVLTRAGEISQALAPGMDVEELPVIR